MTSKKSGVPRNTRNFFFAFAVVVIGLLAVNAFLLSGLNDVQEPTAKPGPAGTLPSQNPPSGEDDYNIPSFPDVSIVELRVDSCEECYEVGWVTQSIVSSAQELGVNVVSVESYNLSSDEGQRLVGAYGIVSAPTLLVMGEGYKSENMLTVFEDYGTVESDGTIVLRSVYAPYWDLVNDRLRGNVSAVYLYKADCADCFDVLEHKDILSNLYGVQIFDEKKVDSDSEEGVALRETYNITWVPTIILSSELGDYPDMAYSWNQFFGTQEADGKYVFRSRGVLNNKTYYDYELNETLTTLPIVYGAEEPEPTVVELD